MSTQNELKIENFETIDSLSFEKESEDENISNSAEEIESKKSESDVDGQSEMPMNSQEGSVSESDVGGQISPDQAEMPINSQEGSASENDVDGQIFQNPLEMPINSQEGSASENDVDGQIFQYQAEMPMNSQEDSDNKNNECDICNLQFKTPYKLELHKKTHTDVCLYNCSFCSSNFKLPRYLNDHIRRCHGKLKPFHCRFCPKRFKKKSALNDHESSKHKTVDHSCKYCFKVLMTQYTLKEHENKCPKNPDNADKIKPKVCQFCEAEFLFSQELKAHISQEHEQPKIKPEEIPVPMLIPLPGVFQCEVCFKLFKRKDYLLQHMPIHTEERSFNCTACNRTFALRRYFKDHLRRFHKLKQSFICDVCNMVFLGKNEFELHKNSHNENTQQDSSDEEDSDDEENKDTTFEEANEDTFEVNQNTSIEEVIQIESSNDDCDMKMEEMETEAIVQVEEAPGFQEYFEINEDPFCESNTYGENEEDEVPEFQEDYEKPAKIRKKTPKAEGGKTCHLCLKQFTVVRYLNDHLRRTHKDERPFDCTICYDSFESATELKSHSTNHEETTNFPCNYCIKRFKNAELKTQHEKNCKAKNV